MKLPEYVRVVRGKEVFVGTFYNASKWLRVRGSTLTDFFLHGHDRGNDRLKGVVIKGTTKAMVERAKINGEAEVDPPTRMTNHTWRSGDYVENHFYMNRFGNFVVCIKADKENDEFHFTAVYVQQDGTFRLADPKNPNCLTITNRKGRRGHNKLIYPVDVNKLDADSFNKFVELRHWYYTKIGLPSSNKKVSLPVKQTILETIVPGNINNLVLEDRIKNIEQFLEKLNEKVPV